jgi:outer membrane protein OmpA-like peptidoglycan-associated protein
MPSDAAKEAESAQQLEQVRTLLLGKDNSKITDSLRKDARKIVAEVITEALHDRQQKDNSVDKVLQPFVEDSVQISVAHNSEQMVISLYPIVGSLVRKSVAAFLSDFMEKTNQLIENSLTIKGLKWRIKARQGGVSYAQYAASQTFVYRVEHVFLIHRETGLLLNTVALDNENKSDADIVSAMLTAINDFVGDSFLTNDDRLKEQLQSVSTENFNLLIKPGPSALVVAAVSGNPPQSISDQLQLTLENIHSLYLDELNSFDGDNQKFENADGLLRDCLLSEQKVVPSNKKKTPWFAWAIVLLILLYTGYKGFNWVKTSQLHDKIMQLDSQPGIVIKQLKIDDINTITLDILRDPDAIELTQWLNDNALNPANFKLIERSYYSLDTPILRQRIQRINNIYPSINFTWQNNLLTLSGTLSLSKTEQLLNTLGLAGFTVGNNLNTEQLQLTSSQPTANTQQVTQQIIDEIIGRIASLQLNFPVAVETITPEMQLTLKRLYQYIEQLEPLAKTLNIKFGLLVLGSSDNTGNKSTNRTISLQRANNAAEVLQELGIDKDKMFVLGLGQIDINDISNSARTVMFNIIHIKNI